VRLNKDAREKPCEQCGTGRREYTEYSFTGIGKAPGQGRNRYSANVAPRWCTRCAEGKPGAVEWHTARSMESRFVEPWPRGSRLHTALLVLFGESPLEYARAVWH
jgi:hypothetical protein